VPEVKKKVPEKKVVVPKKEEAHPATGIAVLKNMRHCHVFLSPIKVKTSLFSIY
jgi:hypothetical protein